MLGSYPPVSMVRREPASVMMAHVREQGVVSREPTSVNMVHVR